MFIDDDEGIDEFIDNFGGCLPIILILIIMGVIAYFVGV